MAALARQEPLLREFYSALKCRNLVKYSSLPPKKLPPKRKPGPLIYHNAQKLESKGYLRPLKAYSPPVDVEDKFRSILNEHAKDLSLESEIKDPLVGYRILEACFQNFEHGVPNSLLHTMKSAGDILQFYKTPVSDLTPMEHLKTKDLPPNLHIQLDPKRFDPDISADSAFGGISAFPQSPTFITDLKARKKFKPTPAQNWTKDWREKATGYIKW
ncbi:hypothetical protein ONE63_005584 [Megalurothrips usitatus]|uniref:Large ribosomal subunit protein mL50 n=1 Tax=Megalurothrips usitatus TaxID=439358 RepID=A0AAV7XZX8_9NEOP|nr:hypothetical protein ONE63_005584 [Megalurothrips usitatus]